VPDGANVSITVAKRTQRDSISEINGKECLVYVKCVHSFRSSRAFVVASYAYSTVYVDGAVDIPASPLVDEETGTVSVFFNDTALDTFLALYFFDVLFVSVRQK
jgi:hypothetical protein